MTKYKVGDVLTWDSDYYDPKVEYTVINTDENTRKYELEYIDPTTTNKDTYWFPIDSVDRGKVSLVGSTTSTSKVVSSTTSTAKIVSTTIPAPREAPKYAIGDILEWRNPYGGPSKIVIIKIDEKNKKYLLEIDRDSGRKFLTSYDFKYFDSNAVLINSSTKDPVKKFPAHKHRCPKCHSLTVFLMFTHYVCERCNAKLTANELFPSDRNNDRKEYEGW